MRYVLGEPFVLDRYRVAVVSRQRAVGHAVDQGAERMPKHRPAPKIVMLACQKEPAFVIVRDGQVTVALDMSGAKVDLAAVAAICPDVQNL